MSILSRRIAQRLEAMGHPTTQAHAQAFTKALVALVEEDTAEIGGKIKIPGIGSFERRFRAGRVARNPRTGETVHTADGDRLRFRPAKARRG